MKATTRTKREELLERKTRLGSIILETWHWSMCHKKYHSSSPVPYCRLLTNVIQWNPKRCMYWDCFYRILSMQSYLCIHASTDVIRHGWWMGNGKIIYGSFYETQTMFLRIPWHIMSVCHGDTLVVPHSVPQSFISQIGHFMKTLKMLLLKFRDLRSNGIFGWFFWNPQKCFYRLFGTMLRVCCNSNGSSRDLGSKDMCGSFVHSGYFMVQYCWVCHTNMFSPGCSGILDQRSSMGQLWVILWKY